MSKLSGKAVIVTGASSGIGETTAILFASRGSNVALCGRDSERLQKAAEKCRQAAKEAGHTGSKIIELQGDVTESSVRTRILKDTAEAFGGVDVLVANHAMVIKDDTVMAVTEDDFDKMFNTNLKSAIFLVKEAVPYLEKNGGSVVCVSSISSRLPTRGNLFLYSLTKASMDHMVRNMAVELGTKGIRVNSVNPTYIRTNIFRDCDMSDQEQDANGELFARTTPMKQPVCLAEDQAEVIAFLASDESRFVNGESLAVDGGVSKVGNPFNFA